MYDHSTLRNYRRMEGYSMFEDGYVLDVKTTTCSSDNGQRDKDFAIISNVKPRTNEKKPYYLTWIIVTKEESLISEVLYILHIVLVKAGK